MEKVATLLIPAILSVLLVRTMLLPLGFLLKTAVHAGFGFLCLWLLNSIAAFTGIFFPINAVTVLIAGFLGLPGIGIMAVLAVMG